MENPNTLLEEAMKGVGRGTRKGKGKDILKAQQERSLPVSPPNPKKGSHPGPFGAESLFQPYREHSDFVPFLHLSQ